MHFDYEISADEYIASQILYHKLSGDRKRIRAAISWTLGGILFIVIAWSERPVGWTTVLLTILGAWWAYCGIVSLSPTLLRGRFRRAYRAADLAGKKYTGDANEDGFEVTGDLYGWRSKWPGVRLKGEDAEVFILYSQGTIFIFGKKYLTKVQQQELRRLSGLSAANP